jgi:ribosomal protein L20
MKNGILGKVVTFGGTIMAMGLLTLGSGYLSRKSNEMGKNASGELERAVKYAWENRKNK